MTQLAQHSAATVEHYTPPVFVEAARATMGGIDLDPASTHAVNDAHIGAAHIFTKDDDGLSRAWFGRVWLNPPGGRVKNRSSQAVWWQKLVEEYERGGVSQAVFLGFSIELLATSQDAPLWPGALTFCVPRRRIEFLTESEGVFVLGESPTHSNIIVGLGVDRDRFREAFQQFGKVRA